VVEREKIIERLMATFLNELEEHVAAINRDLMALEKGASGSERIDLLAALFRSAHSLKGAARSVSVGPIESACHRLEAILGAAREGQLVLGPEIFPLLFETADAIEEAGRRLREKRDPQEPLAALIPRLDEAAARIPRERAGFSRGAGEAPARSIAPGPPAEVPALSPAISASRPPAHPEGSLRVSASKLDLLLARSGELFLARRRAEARAEALFALRDRVERWRADWRAAARALRKVSEGGGRAALAIGRNAQNLETLARDLDRLEAGLAADRHAIEQAAAPLDDAVRRARMVPFSEACEGLDRTVRDLAKAAKKKVELALEGGALELDRSIVEQLRDPLLHLVRNAVDHGIEPPAERAAAGKPPCGRVTVSAALAGGHVEVRVEDDGRGLDLAAIREKARRRGLSEPESEGDLARLIFLPGFSTAPIVTELSGRGVGLDVVKSRVDALHGKIGLSFEPGRGLRVRLLVPLTVTTIRALLVNAAGETFAIATSSVERLVRAGLAEIGAIKGREVLLGAPGGAPVPLASLAELLGLRAREPARPGKKVPVAILAAGEKRAALAFDEVLDEQEALVKSLGARLGRLKKIAGATVLSSGRLALILDAAALVEAALERAPAQSLSQALAEAAPATKKRLLVAEDSVTTRTLEKSILEAAGYEVAAASDGAEAWQLLQEKGADLVLADIEMPRMDGFALVEAIRSSKRFRDLPVVLLTALESEEQKTRGIEVGANAYLLKSAFDQRNLLETIEQLL
jgi:two-component system chemotaxis sensor kinase CheA